MGALLVFLLCQLRRWADLLVIAPLDANTMAKMASGLCDNLLVSFVCVCVSSVCIGVCVHRCVCVCVCVHACVCVYVCVV